MQVLCTDTDSLIETFTT